MAQFPDVYCWVKLIEQPTGKVVPAGTKFIDPVAGNGSITIRYVVANDSNQATGDIMISGILKKDGLPLPMPVPLQTINLASKAVWTHEHTINKSNLGSYLAVLQGDVKFYGSGLEEEDEKNNRAQADFGFYLGPQ